MIRKVTWQRSAAAELREARREQEQRAALKKRVKARHKATVHARAIKGESFLPLLRHDGALITNRLGIVPTR